MSEQLYERAPYLRGAYQLSDELAALCEANNPSGDVAPRELSAEEETRLDLAVRWAAQSVRQARQRARPNYRPRRLEPEQQLRIVRRLGEGVCVAHVAEELDVDRETVAKLAADPPPAAELRVLGVGAILRCPGCGALLNDWPCRLCSTRGPAASAQRRVPPAKPSRRAA